MKTILLTGSTGFLGSHLLEAFLKANYQVVILKRTKSDIWRIRHLMDQVKSYDIDIIPVERAFKEQHIDLVVHTACHYGRNGDSTNQIVKTNLIFSLDLLNACLEFNTGTFINTDTMLPKHISSYALSKKQFVEWLEQASDQIQIVNLRFDHMYGSKDDTNKFVQWIVTQLKDNVAEIKLTKGEQKRDFINVDDVVSSYIAILKNIDNIKNFNEYDVGTGKVMTIKDFLKQLRSCYEEQYGPVKSKMVFGALPYRKGEVMTVEVNNSGIRALNWKPRVDLYSGLIQMIKGV